MKNFIACIKDALTHRARIQKIERLIGYYSNENV